MFLFPSLQIIVLCRSKQLPLSFTSIIRLGPYSLIVIQREFSIGEDAKFSHWTFYHPDPCSEYFKTLMYVCYLDVQPEPLLFVRIICSWCHREFWSLLIFFSIHNHQCSLISLFLASLTKSIGGIPHLSKANIRILVALCFFLLILSLSLSLCFTGCYRRTVKRHSVQIMRLLAGLPVDPNQHGRVRAVETYKGESSEEVADPPVTLSPRGVAAALAVCVFQCNLWSRWLESWAESSRSQPTCHQDDVSWLLPSFS